MPEPKLFPLETDVTEEKDAAAEQGLTKSTPSSFVGRYVKSLPST